MRSQVLGLRLGELEHEILGEARRVALDGLVEPARAHAVNLLMAAALDCYRTLFPKRMDANAYALKVGPASKSLGVVIRSAQWLGMGVAKAIMTAVAVPKRRKRGQIYFLCASSAFWSSSVKNTVWRLWPR